jgi:hypothetical protein
MGSIIPTYDLQDLSGHPDSRKIRFLLPCGETKYNKIGFGIMIGTLASDYFEEYLWKHVAGAYYSICTLVLL